LDEEIARTLQEAEDTFQENLHAAEILQDEDVARQLQESSDDIDRLEDTPRLDRDGAVDPIENVTPGSVMGSPLLSQSPHVTPIQNGMQTPQPRQVDLATREVSHDSTTSDNTSSSHNLGNSVSHRLCDAIWKLCWIKYRYGLTFPFFTP
jgi:hypothetical protein